MGIIIIIISGSRGRNRDFVDNPRSKSWNSGGKLGEVASRESGQGNKTRKRSREWSEGMFRAFLVSIQSEGSRVLLAEE